MAGRFEGLKDAERKLLEDIFPNEFIAVNPDSRAGGASFREGRDGHQKVPATGGSNHGMLMEHCMN